VAHIAADSAGWIIGQLADEARLAGEPLSEEDLALLRLPLAEAVGEVERPQVFALNNRLVPLARRRMDHAKAMGQPCTKVRRGLRVPTDWHFHYTQLVETDYPGVLSQIMHNVMLANSMSGEHDNWKSS
jgi:hypothetical protein